MECNEPGIIRDEELLAYLAGERVRPVVEQHLARCPGCSAKVADYRGLERSLVQRLYRWECPPSQILGEYQLGLLSNEQNNAIRLHLTRCVLCAEEVAALAGFLENDPFLAPPVAVHARRKNHHGQAQDVRQVMRGLGNAASQQVRRIIATLIPQQPRLAYQRTTTSLVTWPRRYAAEDLTISIQVERVNGRNDALQLIGFVTRKGATLEALEGAQVQLLSSGGQTYMQQIDDLGNFVFSPVAPGTYTLELQLAESTIVIEQLLVVLED